MSSDEEGRSSAIPTELPDNIPRIEELDLDDSDSQYEDVVDETEINGPPFPGKFSRSVPHRNPDHRLPPWLQTAYFGLFHDDLVTKTSESQDEVTVDCLPLLTQARDEGFPLNSHGIPHLAREAHANFLRATLRQLPAPYVAADASRPWFFCWALGGLTALGHDVSEYRDRLRDTVRPLQHPSGGFGGGHGQIAHCAGSYATVLALAIVDALDVVDRKAMWHWLGQLKQADGGFRMAINAEEDIRGAYCALTLISLLNIPLTLPPDSPARQEGGISSFLDGLGDWVGRCQTYEGGIGGAPDTEAHGAYAFCALACLSIIDAPHQSICTHLDAPALLAWLAARQTSPEGGFQGRQEKLVDACYSHWVGGCFELLEAALLPSCASSAAGGAACDVFNRAALIRYLLCCAQQPGKKGGMRDKPSTRPDGYHTAYSLAGLSHAQNRYAYNRTGATQDPVSGRLTAALNWTARRASADEWKAWKIDEEDVVDFVHPVFTVPMDVVERISGQFVGREESW